MDESADHSVEVIGGRVKGWRERVREVCLDEGLFELGGRMRIS